MAIDGNFLAFLVPAVIAVLAAAVGFPSKSRIQEDPSTAYTGGRKALVVVAAILSLAMGLALAGLGSTYSRETVVAGINMIQIGGISLIIITVVLMLASAVIGRQIKRAGKGERERVLEVAAIRPTAPPRDLPPRDLPPRDLPPRDLPPRDLPPRDLPPRDLPPRDGPPRRGTPPPRDLPPRPRHPPGDEVPPPPRRVERRPPPRRYPPPE
jgi:hypothetical protein